MCAARGCKGLSHLKSHRRHVTKADVLVLEGNEVALPGRHAQLGTPMVDSLNPQPHSPQLTVYAIGPTPQADQARHTT